MNRYRFWLLLFAVTLLMALPEGINAQEIAAARVPVAEPAPMAPEPAALAQPTAVMEPSLLRNTTVVRPRVADREFWRLVGTTAGSAILDGESTIRSLQTPGRRELNPLLGSHPNRLRFYTTVGVADAGLSYLAYRLKRNGHNKAWKIPFYAMTAVHLGGSINNLRY